MSPVMLCVFGVFMGLLGLSLIGGWVVLTLKVIEKEGE